LTHAIEGYTCTWHTDMTDGLCAHAASEIFEHLPRAMEDGSDMQARTRMHHAATSAGLGFGNAMASLAHAMGHAVGSTFHMPHGRAVSICLPYTLEFIAREAPGRAAQFANRTGISSDPAEPGARALAQAVRHLANRIGNPTSLAEADVGRVAFDDALPKLVEHAENDTQAITAARSPSSEQLADLFRAAYDGTSVAF
jgi:alcohol dehydrogenase class IV